MNVYVLVFERSVSCARIQVRLTSAPNRSAKEQLINYFYCEMMEALRRTCWAVHACAEVAVDRHGWLGVVAKMSAYEGRTAFPAFRQPENERKRQSGNNGALALP